MSKKPLILKVVLALTIAFFISKTNIETNGLLIGYIALSVVLDELYFLQMKRGSLNQKRDRFGVVVAIIAVALTGFIQLGINNHIQTFTVMFATFVVAYLQLLKHNPLETFTKQQSYKHIATMCFITLLSYLLLTMGLVSEKWAYGLALLSLVVALRGGGIKIGEFAKFILYELVLGKDYPKDN